MDIRLHYIEKGNGEPLILLHGNGENLGYFMHQIAYFSNKYRVIAIDTRGHGQSPWGTAPFTIRQFAEDLKEFMEWQEIERANILGFSDGGNIAMIFAVKYPEKVDRLILNGANLYGSGVKFTVQFPIVIGYGIASLLGKWSFKARKNARMLRLMVHDPNIRPEELHAIKTPVLVIAGTHDMIKNSHTQLIYEHLPNAECKWIEGDHFIANKNPKEFNRAVEDFLLHTDCTQKE